MSAAAASHVRVRAQAKINLRLRVLAQETSGYHQLETLFLRLDLADEITVRRVQGPGALHVSGTVAEIGPPDHNLAWRAAQAYRAACGMSDDVEITLIKHIPIGGGLGGGSADAGAVLRAMDALTGGALGERATLALAATLGADVPFLTLGQPYALAWGRGERLLPLAPLDSMPCLLMVPPFAVSTSAAFGWVAEDRAGTMVAADTAVLVPGELSDWNHLLPFIGNDFEIVVAARHPAIGALVAAGHDAGGRLSMLTGSGSTVFAIGDSLGQPAALPPGTQTVMTRTASHVEPVHRIH